uniref:Uncharacterized protein n=1 Tax=Oryza punctata TaxID=4537 RepID=A0A0E0ML74_ORYPU
MVVVGFIELFSPSPCPPLHGEVNFLSTMAMPWATVACILRNVWALLDGWISVCCLAADELAGLLRSALG